MKPQDPSSFSAFHYIAGTLLVTCVGGYFLFRLISLEFFPFTTAAQIEEAREAFTNLR